MASALGLPNGRRLRPILWVIALFWPAARHPVRAAALCASLSGTICLITLISEPANLETLLVLSAVVVLGVIYGYSSSWLKYTSWSAACLRKPA